MMKTECKERNIKKVKGTKCWGCKFLHIGIKVDHNHCDSKNATIHMDRYYVNGHRNEEGCLEREVDPTQLPSTSKQPTKKEKEKERLLRGKG